MVFRIEMLVRSGGGSLEFFFMVEPRPAGMSKRHACS